jgi:hypothetical protein
MREIVAGLMVVVGIAISFGKLDDLHRFARREAAKALRGWQAPPPFFQKGYKITGHSHERKSVR